MEHRERDLELVAHWNTYEEILNHIFFPYVAGIYAVCVILGKPISNFAHVTAFSNIPHVLISLDGVGQTNLSTSSLLAGIESGCNSFLVYQHAVQDFLDVFIKVHDQAGYRNANKHIIFLLEYSDSDGLLESIRGHSSMREIIHLLIFQPTYDGSAIDLLTHRFTNTGQDVEWYLVDRYTIDNHSFSMGHQLFPDKTLDWMGKAIRVATFDINPHIFMVEPEIETPVIKYDNQAYSLNGPNGILLMEFARRHNCSIELIVDTVNMWGEIHPNRTGNGILGNVAERRADVGVGALSSWYHCYQYLAFSFAYERGGVACLVPKPKQLPRWKEIAMGFTRSVYVAIFVAFCCIVACYILIVRFAIQGPMERSVVWHALNVLAIYLLQSTSIVRNRSASESLLSVAVLFFSMNLATIYLGKYASLRTIPMFEQAIDTKESLAQSGIPWIQAHEAWSYSLRLSKNPTEVSLLSNFRVYPLPTLRQMADEGNSAFALARLHNGHLMLGDWINADNIRKYHLMRNDLYFEHEVAMATKTWPLMERFNELLGQATEASLLLLKEYQNINQYNDYYVQMVALNSHIREPNDPKALAVEDVLGGLIVLGFGLLCAFVNFIVEIWVLCPSKTVLVKDNE